MPSRKRKCDQAVSPRITRSSARREAATKERGTNTRPPRPQIFCPICMEDAVPKQPVSTLCGHCFCRRCITQACDENNRCPICRQLISKFALIRIRTRLRA